MKNLLTIITITFLEVTTIFCQNKLYNGSFETGSGVSICPGQSFNNYLSNWKSRYDDDGSTGYCYSNTCPAYHWHSPDWFYYISGNNNNCYSEKVESKFETHYVGFAPYELIQQKLTNSNKLVVGKKYRVDFNIYNPVKTEQVQNYPNYTLLNVILSKNKIKYKKENSKFYCTEKYKKHTTPGDEILLYSLDMGTVPVAQQNPQFFYPKSNWQKVSFIFTAQNSFINAYNWVSFELVNKDINYGCTTSYIYLDDISLYETDFCNLDPCDRTDGPIAASGPHRVGPDPNDLHAPFCVNKLDNVSEAKDIYILWNGDEVSHLPNVYSVNGIYNPIYWNGKTGGGGQTAGQVWYTWSMRIFNACGEYDYAVNFFKDGDVSTVIDVPPVNPPYNNSVVTPLPCCEAQPDIYVQNVIIYGSGLAEYVAMNNIYTAGNVIVQYDADNVIFQAGNEIHLTPGFHAQAGSHFHAYIAPCTPNAHYKNEIQNNDSLILTELSLNIPDSLIEYSIPVKDSAVLVNYKPATYSPVIFPKINHGSFNISVDGLYNELLVLEIFNSSGISVYRKQIVFSEAITMDITGLSQGLYIIKLNSSKVAYTDKIIYQ